MAYYSLVFYSSPESELTTELQCFVNSNNQITILISDPSEFRSMDIVLDKGTAIKLSRTLKSAINELNVIEKEG
jgi:hypothetical protein